MGLFLCQQKLRNDKLASLDKNKAELMSAIKQTAAKLRFTLQGSVAKEAELIKMSITAAQARLSPMETVIMEVTETLTTARSHDGPSVKVSEKLLVVTSWFWFLRVKSLVFCIDISLASVLGHD